jgi:histidinol-phosphatase (PHP family)
VTLPPDSHVHTEWSWDAPDGSMEGACARAVDIGLPAIAFTEHLDHTAWVLDPAELADSDHLASLATADGLLVPPGFDASGYLEAIEACRQRFPSLRILSGLEMGEPHRHRAATARVLSTGRFDRVLGSLHCLPDGDGFAEPPGLYKREPAAEVMRRYLAEVVALVSQSEAFSVLAHIDYPVRFWPAEGGPFDPLTFEEEFRHALGATARSGRALEVSTAVPLHSTILQWWHEEGGEAITFGSDAHDPSGIAEGFSDAADMAAAHGFRAGRDPYDFWGRSGS